MLLLVLLCGYAFLVQGMRFFLVPSGSMLPTLHPGDQLVTIRKAEYQRGDIVVIRDTREGGYIVKRLIGLGGDTVNLEFGATHINGAYISEPYLFEPMQFSLENPLQVPLGHISILGDNRNYSDDSAFTGETWPETEIVGKVVFRYFPYDRLGWLQGFPLLP